MCGIDFTMSGLLAPVNTIKYLCNKGKAVSLSVKIKNNYGSKLGLLRYAVYELLRILGFYRSFKKVDFTQVQRLVFVCHGNICRSPLGEAVARKQGVATISFGLSTRGNAPADPRAITWAEANGYELLRHRTLRVDQYQPQIGDLLIGMEPKHVYALSKNFCHSPVQITLAGLWLNSPIAYLHDPYNTDQKYFSRCETFVVSATNELIKRLNR